MKQIGLNELKNMFSCGVNKLVENYEYINELNVFPVPDGDTGTNMKITSSCALEEVNSLSLNSVSMFGQAFSRALLMNARGNSGVIFSQIIKGFVLPLVNCTTTIKLELLFDCFKSAKEVAYESVANPVEGTILTVIRAVHEAIDNSMSKITTITELFDFARKVAKKALDKTPEMLPELKKVGVVDSGGYGLWCFLTGMYEGLTSKVKTKQLDITKKTQPQKKVKNHLIIDDHDYEEGFGYCSEIILKLNSRIDPMAGEKKDFYLDHFKNELLKFGNSLVCVQDNDIVKVHIHTLTPGVFLNTAQKYGEFVKVKIDNMTEQFYERLKDDGVKVINTIKTQPLELKLEDKPNFVVTCPSKKIKKILQTDYGFKHVVCTESTGNPSIQDILLAVQEAKSRNVIFITDDSNIVLAANQVVGILQSTINLKIVKGTNIFEALLAGLEFDIASTLEQNHKIMNKAIDNSYSALISKSVKDVDYTNVMLSKDDFIGMIDKKIVVADKDEYVVLKKTIDTLISKMKHADVLMIFYDNKKRLPILKKLEEYVSEKYNLLCEFKEGGQKVYNYYIGLQ